MKMGTEEDGMRKNNLNIERAHLAVVKKIEAGSEDSVRSLSAKLSKLNPRIIGENKSSIVVELPTRWKGTSKDRFNFKIPEELRGMENPSFLVNLWGGRTFRNGLVVERRHFRADGTMLRPFYIEGEQGLTSAEANSFAVTADEKGHFVVEEIKIEATETFVSVKIETVSDHEDFLEEIAEVISLAKPKEKAAKPKDSQAPKKPWQPKRFNPQMRNLKTRGPISPEKFEPRRKRGDWKGRDNGPRHGVPNEVIHGGASRNRERNRR